MNESSLPTNNQSAKQPVCGYVALLGLPNAGKSTLINALVGEKVAIVSPKAQTTRHCIRGIVNDALGQIIFVDTPGFTPRKSPLAKHLRRGIRYAMHDADVAVILADVRDLLASSCNAESPYLHWHRTIEAAQQAHKHIIIGLNKIDLLPDKLHLLPIIEQLASRYPDVTIMPLSARKREGLSQLQHHLLGLLPAGAPFFPEDMHTDQAERTLCAEFIREQILMAVQQEVPHSAAVVIEHFKERANTDKPLVHIEARIILERDSQKPIVIGKGGQRLKHIGSAARKQIERLLGTQVFLGLQVKVDPSWSQSEVALKRLGFSAPGECTL